jgi:anti-anti-sigma factor
MLRRMLIEPQGPRSIAAAQGPALLLVLEPAPDHAVRVRCSGELDLATTDHLETQVRRLVASGCNAVSLDLRGLGFFDCSGLRLLMRLKLDAATDGWSLGLVYGDGPVRRLLELTDTGAWFTEAA